MAEVTFTRPALAPPVTFTLVLTEAEALYVRAALLETDPTAEAEAAGVAPGDPVYGALDDALDAAGVGPFAGDGFATTY